MGICTDTYELSFTPAQMKVFETAAALRGATLREFFEGVLGILGDDPVILENVIDDGLGE